MAEQVFQVDLKTRYVEQVRFVLEVHEEVVVALVGVVSAGDRTDQRDGASLAAQGGCADLCLVFDEHIVASAHAWNCSGGLCRGPCGLGRKTVIVIVEADPLCP